MDRNRNSIKRCLMSVVSLSARRAWIEIALLVYLALIRYVALRKESVDRNFDAMQIVVVIVCRSPQGERG